MSSYDTDLQAIHARAGYGKVKYLKVLSYLQQLDSKQFNVKKASWHRKCYQEATHTGNLKRSRESMNENLQPQG